MHVVSFALSIVSVFSSKPFQSSLSSVPGGTLVAVVGGTTAFVPFSDGRVDAGEPEVGGRWSLSWR